MSESRNISESVSVRLLAWNRDDRESDDDAATGIAEFGGRKSVMPDRFRTGSGTNATILPPRNDAPFEDNRAFRAASFIDANYIQILLTGSPGQSRYGGGSYKLRAYREMPEVRYGRLIDIYV